MKSFSKYDPAMALRAFKVRFGERGMKTSSIETATEGVSVDGDSTVEDTVNYADAGESTVIVDDTPAPVNEDVWRRNFWRHKGMTKLRRLWRRLRRVGEFVKRFRDPKLSRDEHLWRLLHLREWNEDDLEDHRRRKEAARLHAFHVSQAKILKPRIIETLTRLKFATIHIRSDREYVRRRPHITRVDVSPYAYTFYVSVARLVGVKETDMVTDEVATILSISMQKKVRAELDAVAGLRYTVMIASTLTIPNYVSFNELSSMPNNLPPLAFFAGLSNNGKPVYRDLSDAPHVLVAGGSGGGKSNCENLIACTLISRNSPNVVQLAFFDLKGGVEFGLYDGLPHLYKKRGQFTVQKRVKKKYKMDSSEARARLYLKFRSWKDIAGEDDDVPSEFTDIMDDDSLSLGYDDAGVHSVFEVRDVDVSDTYPAVCDGIVEFPEQAMPAFHALRLECNERLALLREAKVKNIADYNRNRREANRMPYIVVFVDEWASTKRLVGDDAEKSLEILANLSRAVGIHFVLAAQNPKAEIINTAITVNFQWRIAFSMTTAASQAVLGSWDACGLSPKGRAIFVNSDGQVEVQTPEITTKTINSIIDAAKSGKGLIQRQIIDVEEVLVWALENTRGKLSADVLYENFKERVTVSELRDLLKTTDNRTYYLRGAEYRVIPGSVGKGNSRRMEKIPNGGVEMPEKENITDNGYENSQKSPRHE